VPAKPPPRQAPTTASRLSATDWAQAALTAIGEGGLSAVAVEPLAKRLGATKGSFYWHYPNRQALIDAALQTWESEHTEAVIAAISTHEDPAEQLRALLVLVVDYSRNDTVEVALLASAQNPEVASIIARVTRRRIDYVADLYTRMGDTPSRARRRATLAVSVYLGHTQLAHVSTALVPDGDEWRLYLDELVDTLTLPNPGVRIQES
jgi:AcrR family transcriptional regulator